MKAIRVHCFGGPQVLKFETNVPIPEVGENQVLVKVSAAGINPVDTYIRSGNYGVLPSLPYIPGSDGAGVVAAVGSRVKRFQKGQRVFTSLRNSGVSAEYVVANDDHIFPLDDKLSFEQGAAIGVPYITAYRALFLKGHALPSETLLVHGASGSVGLAAVQIASARGLTVFGTAGSEDGERLVLENGAHRVFSHRKDGYVKEILAATNNKGVDVILENLANVNLSSDLDLLAPNGRVLIVGNRGSIEINPRALMPKESSIIGVAITASTPKQWHEINAAVAAGIATGWIKPVVNKVYPLERIAQAHTDVIASSGAKGKLVLKID